MVQGAAFISRRMFSEAMEDARLQGNFVRAADAMFAHALAQLVIFTAQELLRLLNVLDSSAAKVRITKALPQQSEYASVHSHDYAEPSHAKIVTCRRACKSVV